MRFHWGSPAFSGQLEAFRIGATPETNAWIWIHAVIMREEGETIGKVGEGFFAIVLSGLGWCGSGWGLDIGGREWPVEKGNLLEKDGYAWRNDLGRKA
jgi:hypothetical protein